MTRSSSSRTSSATWRSGEAPREAACAAMKEVTGPIIAITAVLAAVFIPTAFLGGLTGQFYRQFALTIAISTVLSAINSLTLSPALAALLLRPHGAAAGLAARACSTAIVGPFTRRFNRALRPRRRVRMSRGVGARAALRGVAG